MSPQSLFNTATVAFILCARLPDAVALLLLALQAWHVSQAPRPETHTTIQHMMQCNEGSCLQNV
jgi:hypothetical protein